MTVTLKSIRSIAIGLCALCLVTLVGGTYWAMHATIDLDRFKPRIVHALQTAVPGLKVALGHLHVQRDPFRALVRLTVDETHLTHPMGQATIQALTIDLSLIALLDGRWVARDVAARGLHGVVRISNTMGQTKAHIPWVRGLRSLHVQESTLTLVDKDHDRSVDIAVQSLAAHYTSISKTIRLAGTGQATALGATTTVGLKATAKPFGPWDMDVRLRSSSYPKLLQNLLPQAPRAAPLLLIGAHVQYDHQLRVDANFSLESGLLDWPAYYPKPLALQRGEAHVTWQGDGAPLTVHSATLLLAGSKITGSGDIVPSAPSLSQGLVRIDHLDVPRLVALWPHTLSPGGRTWIRDHVRQARIHDGVLRLWPASHRCDRARPPCSRVDFTFALDDMVVDYRPPMPPLLNAAATGRLTEHGLALAVHRGTIHGLGVVPATVAIEDWSASPTMLSIAMPMGGDLSDLLTVLDSRPLQFISRYGVAPDTVRGRVRAKATLRLPLLQSLKTDDIIINGTATTQDAYVPAVYAGHPLAHAYLRVSLNNEGMTARGPALVGAQPIDLTWTEDFTGRSDAPSLYHIQAQTSIAALAALNIDLTSVASGPVVASLDLAMRGPVLRRGSFTADGAALTLTLTPFGIIKAPGVAATVSGTLRQHERILEMDNVVLDSAPTTLHAQMRVPLDAGRTVLSVSRFNFGRNRLAGQIRFGEQGPVEVAVHSGVLNAQPLLQGWGASSQADPPVSDVGQTLITATLDQVELVGGHPLKQVKASVESVGDRIKTLDLTAKLNASDFSISLLETGAGGQTLHIKSDDAGEMLRSLALVKSARGGVIDATMVRPPQGTALQGRGIIRNIRLLNTPTLARVLMLPSFSGLSDVAAGRGLLFRTVDIPFRLERGVVDIRKARATGPALGVTLEGQIQKSLTAMNLKGVIIPAYTLNTALSNIPLLGPMLTGGKGQGLIGLNYRVTGPAADPKIDVYASSGLALGPLRLLFSGAAAELTPAEKALE